MTFGKAIGISQDVEYSYKELSTVIYLMEEIHEFNSFKAFEVIFWARKFRNLRKVTMGRRKRSNS